MEQDLKIRQLKDALEKPETTKEDIIIVFLALQRQCFVLGNNMSNLLKNWNKPQDRATTVEELLSLGITFETKD